MKVALDAMGGDFAPGVAVQGALAAAPLIRADIILVGDQERIEGELGGKRPKNIIVHHASEVIGMQDKPIESVRRKKDSSIVVGANLVKEREAQAFVSAGNTGAVSSATLLAWRQVAGVHRPAIASIFPSCGKPFVLLDAGASPDVDPVHLMAFGVMGRAYAQRVFERADPKVHLLNIGEEEGKGNTFTKAAYDQLKQFEWFDGNIEGKDMFKGGCDVVVCDAFVGNVLLKTAEGIGDFLVHEVRKAVPRGPQRLLYWPVKKVMSPLRRKMDYAEYGGSFLLGLNGNCVICHGRSNAKAIKNALLMAATAAENNLLDTIKGAFEQLEKVSTVQ